ncbi:hypothetical protein HGRIS_012742 [Hohenbuehelia grisea]
MPSRCPTTDDLREDLFHACLTSALDNLTDEYAEKRALRRVRTSRLYRAVNSFGMNFESKGDVDSSVPSDFEDDDESKDDASVRSWSAPSSTQPTSTPRNSRSRAKEATTTILPKVARIAQSLFERRLEVLGTAAGHHHDDEVAAEADLAQEHHLDPESMQWGNLIWRDEEGVAYYDSITMDGVKYSIADVVMVNPGSDSNRSRAANSQSKQAMSENSYANKLWFARICYFFDDNGNQMFHGQWFVHGSTTILQETAHSKSLYIINECDDNPTASIYKMCNVQMLRPGEEEIPDDFEPDSNNFHCGLRWDEENTEFIDTPCRKAVENAIAAVPLYKPCYCCGLRVQEETRLMLRRIPRGFTQFGIRYHVGDFVYLKPWEEEDVPDPGAYLLGIGQITKIKGIPNEPVISVRLFERLHHFIGRHPGCKGVGPPSGLLKDDRCLVRRMTTKQFTPDDVRGICYIQRFDEANMIQQWIEPHSDHFYCCHDELDCQGGSLEASETDLAGCEVCLQDHLDSLQQLHDVRRRHGAITGLELFAGAGGLSTGMHMSKFVDTKYAVEIHPPAAESFRRNHPGATVYCQDTNLLLKHVIEKHEGKNPGPLPSLIPGDKNCAPLPPKGDVTFIYGGAPCQAFSHINHSRDPNDIRSTLVCNMLSYVEFYEPDYFLLENVVGLLHFQLLASKQGNRMVDGIVMGVVKLVQRTLIALGYQVKHRVLEAAQYGAPQNRLRVIFWGAKRGVPIPSFPIPTHGFIHSRRAPSNYQQPHGTPLRPVTRVFDPDEPNAWGLYAPMLPVTINDAISDLPAFDWRNPHETIAATHADKQESRHRRKVLKIPEFDALLDNKRCPGYPEPVLHASKPMNWYQVWVRRTKLGPTDDESMNSTIKFVRSHYTKSFSPLLVERAVNIKMEPLADHHSLPPELQMNHDTRSYNNFSFYGRLNGNEFFRTVLTQCSPNIKSTFPLHPSQKRIYTIREMARAQGFPDDYIFASFSKIPGKVVDDQYRQIGNAVPVQLSLALGKSLGEALVKGWLQNEREGSPEV